MSNCQSYNFCVQCIMSVFRVLCHLESSKFFNLIIYCVNLMAHERTYILVLEREWETVHRLCFFLPGENRQNGVRLCICFFNVCLINFNKLIILRYVRNKKYLFLPMHRYLTWYSLATDSSLWDTISERRSIMHLRYFQFQYRKIPLFILVLRNTSLDYVSNASDFTSDFLSLNRTGL